MSSLKIFPFQNKKAPQEVAELSLELEHRKSSVTNTLGTFFRKPRVFVVAPKSLLVLLKKEVIQPHLPIRLPCYDFTPFTSFTLVVCFLAVGKDHFGCSPLRWCDGRCVQGPGTYSPRHADPRLLAIPTSWSRVADSNPNWDRLFEISSPSRVGYPLYRPL